MGKKMSLELRRELVENVSELYREAGSRAKRQMLDQFVNSTGYSRKHAIVLLNRQGASNPSRIRRKRRYDERVQQALVSLWKAANRICAKRLAP